MTRTTRNRKPPGWLLLAGLPLGISFAIGGGIWLAFHVPETLVPLVMGGVLVAIVAWVATSVLWPARADRTCPSCRHDGLVRADPDAAEGVVCTACGWKDSTQSSWYMAEEEMECLEELSLRRREKRTPRDGHPPRARLEETLP